MARVLKVLHHDIELGTSRYLWEMQLVRTRNGLSFRFGIEDGHRLTPKAHTWSWHVSIFYRYGSAELDYYRVSSRFGGDRRIGDKMMARMMELSEQHSELLREVA